MLLSIDGSHGSAHVTNDVQSAKKKKTEPQTTEKHVQIEVTQLMRKLKRT